MNRLLLVIVLNLAICLIGSNSFAGITGDGTDDSVNTDSAVLTGYPLTLSGWIKTSNLTANPTMISIVDKDANDEMFGIGIAGDASGDPARIFCYSTASGFEATDSSTGITAGVWHHVAGVFTNSTSRTIYIDGGSATTDTVSCTPAGLDRTTIGALRRSSDTGYIDGSITDVTIWDTALSAAEISLLASSKIKRLPLQIKFSNLSMYQPLDDYEEGASVNGNTYYDLSSNGFNIVADDGANNTGMTALAEEVLSYP